MNKRLSQSAYRWMLAGVWAALIYLTLPLMPTVWISLSEFSWASFAIKAIVVGVAVVSVIALIVRKYIRSPVSFFLLFLLAGAYLWGIRILSIPAERMHFIEYGVLAVLVYRALVLQFKNGLAYMGAFLVTSLVDLGDEGIQYLLPNRYYQFRDVVLNMVSAALALALLYIIYRDGNRRNMQNQPIKSS